ncbi:hypothetical protein, partial [Tianweitania sediminis]
MVGSFHPRRDVAALELDDAVEGADLGSAGTDHVHPGPLPGDDIESLVRDRRPEGGRAIGCRPRGPDGSLGFWEVDAYPCSGGPPLRGHGAPGRLVGQDQAIGDVVAALLPQATRDGPGPSGGRKGFAEVGLER